MGKHDALIILQKHQDLMGYLLPILHRAPKAWRFTLIGRIIDSMLTMATLMVEANQRQNKLDALYRLDRELEKLRLLCRLAVQPDIRVLTVKQYGLMSERTDEIGRILGGWLKSQRPG